MDPWSIGCRETGEARLNEWDQDVDHDGYDEGRKKRGALPNRPVGGERRDKVSERRVQRVDAYNYKTCEP